MILSISDLAVRVAGIPILREVSISIDVGETVGLVGRNGAGKTTLLRSILRCTEITSGTIEFGGQSITFASQSASGGLGIAYVPEDRKIIGKLSVEDNLLLPLWVQKVRSTKLKLARVYDIIPELKPIRLLKGVNLSGGQQKLVALGRALISSPTLLLLDEPFEGVAPVLARRLAEIIGEASSDKMSVLLAESDLSSAAGILNKIYHIERGTILK